MYAIQAQARSGCCLTVAVIAVVIFFTCGCSKTQKGDDTPIVQTVQNARQDVPVYTEWIGTTDGKLNAAIRAQVQGYLIRRNYHEGDFVRKGQLLFEIDPRTFQAAYDQSKAQLAEQQARWATARANLARVIPLVEQNALSKRDLDDATGQEQAIRAAVLSAQAVAEKTRLDLGFTKIVSPVDGIAGIAKAQIGNLVGPGVLEELTTVSAVDPIKVYVSVGERQYLDMVGNGGSGFKDLPLELILSSGDVHPQKGHFVLADRQVDVKTGTIKLVAFFGNPGNILRPGQFAKIRAKIRTKKGALLVPQRAVTELQGGHQIAVLGAGNKIDIRSVKAAERIGSSWVIDEGLNSGEQVVVEGLQKVRQGTVVNPQPYRPVQPPNGGKFSPGPQKADAPGTGNK